MLAESMTCCTPLSCPPERETSWYASREKEGAVQARGVMNSALEDIELYGVSVR